MIATYTSKPVLVQAAQWLPDDADQRVAILKWLDRYEFEYQPDGSVIVSDGSGNYQMDPTDWFIEIDDGVFISPDGEFQDLFDFQRVVLDPKQLTLF